MARAAKLIERLGRSRTLLPALIVLLAFALRVHALDAQSLWNDEGNSLRLARRSLGALVEATARDIHPPGYYVLLKAWIALAGESELALRMLSALQGTLTVAVTVALGRAFGVRTAWLGALLVALSPFAVYYSQEARMYAQLGLLSAASMWVLVWALGVGALPPRPQQGASPPAPRRTARRAILQAGVWVVFALIHTLGLYTHYAYPFSLAAQMGVLALWTLAALGAPPGPGFRQASKRLRRFGALKGARRRARSAHALATALVRAWGGYAAAAALTLALVAPWLPTAWQQVSTWPRTGVPFDLPLQLHTVAIWLTYGNTAGDVSWARLLWPALLIAVALWPRGGKVPATLRAWALALWGGATIAGLFASGAYREANLKFLLPAQIAAALLMARGAERLWAHAPRLPRLTLRERRYIARLVAAVSVFLVLIGQANALQALYTDPTYARADYRAIAAYLSAHATSADAIILDAPNQAEVFTYYYRGPAALYPLPRGLGGDDAQTRAEVQAVVAAHRRIFVLFWGEQERDPRRVVQSTLDAEAYPVASWWYGDVRLAQYAVLGPAPEAPDVALDARFGERVRLVGYALRPAEPAPGDALGVTLFWVTDAPLEARYKVTVQLLGPDGVLVAQHDAEPAGNRAPTTSWRVGEMVRDTHGVALPPELPSGRYTLVVGMYTLEAPHARLPIFQDGAAVGDVLVLQTFTLLDVSSNFDETPQALVHLSKCSGLLYSPSVGQADANRGDGDEQAEGHG